MHVEEFTRLFGALVIIVALGAAAWIGAQVIPQVQAVAVMPAKIQAESARLDAQAKLDAAQLDAQRVQIEANAQTAKDRAALDLEAKRTQIANDQARAQAQIESERTKANASATATIQEANAKAQAEIIRATSAAEGARASGTALTLAAVAFVIAALGFAGFFFAREWIGARTMRGIVELVAREGGRLELPNGHAVHFLPAAQRLQLTEGTHASATRAYTEDAAQLEHTNQDAPAQHGAIVK